MSSSVGRTLFYRLSRTSTRNNSSPIHHAASFILKTHNARSFASILSHEEKSPPLALHRKRIEIIAHNLGIRKPEDWYACTVRQIENAGAGNLLTHYGRSLYTALSQIYPEHEWKPWMFHKLPKEWASKIENQRLYLDWTAHQLGFSNLDGWYSVSRDQFTKRFGRGILGQIYNDSIHKMLLTVYPEHPWVSSRFQRLSAARTSWKDPEVRKRTFQIALDKLSLKTIEDLASVKVADFVRATGAATLIYGRYKGSLLLALQDTYPDITFPNLIDTSQSKSRRVYKRRDPTEESKRVSLLKDTAKQRLWLENLMKDRQIKSLPDLAEISSQEFKTINAEAAFLVRRYGSVRTMISTLFGEESAKAEVDVLQKRKLTKQAVGVKEFMQSASAALGLSSLDSWYSVSAPQLLALPKGKKILKLYNNDIHDILKDAYPEHLWDEWRFIASKGRRSVKSPS
eukprot:TRINITY_DN8020_c0_g1_i1.p1 TRINITY_DN8020_c0_g1~~TRINITY_DN8020_c0_g1_i1.p1  ORF type:complete len:456 (-),score=51.34 TRINITY_DN8020_c0_g1_i1:344-1711(-)